MTSLKDAAAKEARPLQTVKGKQTPPAKQSQLTQFFKSTHPPKPHLQKKESTKNKRKLPKRLSARIILSTLEMVDYHDTPIKRKIQTTLDGNIAGGDNDSHYADKLQLIKPAGVLRIIAGNPCNLPAHATMDKNKRFFNSIKHLDADITMIAEHGLCLSNLDENDYLQARASAVLRSAKVTADYNKHQPTSSKHQRGGTAIVTTHEATTRYLSTGPDSTGLGRWVSTTTEGSKSHVTRYVAAYNPCYSNMLNSVYQQHVRYLTEANRDLTPHEAFEADLRDSLIAWIEYGDHIVLYTDANQDVRDGPLQRMFKSVGMHDLILHKHSKEFPPPATYA